MSEAAHVSADPGDIFQRGRRPRARRHAGALAVVTLGGALGASARYGLGMAIPVATGGFPWPTFTVNVTGCLLIGIFMVAITEMFGAHRLLRPFAGVGFLGGFTTLSSYAVGAIELAAAGHYRTALVYAVVTVLASVLAVIAGVVATRAAFGTRRLQEARYATRR